MDNEKIAQVKIEDDAYVSLKHIDKIYENNVQAVFDFNFICGTRWTNAIMIFLFSEVTRRQLRDLEMSKSMPWKPMFTNRTCHY